ncbi:tRNA:m(4)X modification enzyme TRM13 homolog isoform X2 [Tribolium madens]|uniref:tRNA:m(4)X modification enzyme TRM13 homolog isoform X2 n=1 Tax=Tribolium madens TaxID=41895 RepID=UPI001CF761BC|nr:tRNA:m(4)X modification enzyme TRM13 homolog isoform X2 [Tribolium madens]
MCEEPPHCNHFVVRKKRFCRMSVKPGDRFCGEHQPAGATNDDKIRIVCPLDPKHTCYAHNLRKHLKICNARPGAAVAYIQQGVNLGDAPEDHKSLSEFSTSEIVTVIGRINKIFEEFLSDQVTGNFRGHSVVEAELAKPEYGDKSKKHLKQASAILDKLDAVSGSASIVGVTKHLCGDATDLALRCLLNVSSVKVGGLTMTFCCHHRCRWGAYVGKDFFNRVGLTKPDFEMMCGMSSWATCGTGLSREKNQIGGTVEGNERDKEIGVTRSQKEELGRRAKALLNWGRLQFLEGLGFECRLHYYVEADVSLENVCIVAKNKTS